jgi:hypothetical protein
MKNKNLEKLKAQDPGISETINMNMTVRDWIEAIDSKLIIPYEHNRGGIFKPYSKKTAHSVCNHLNPMGLSNIMALSKDSDHFIIADGHSRTKGIKDRIKLKLMEAEDYDIPMTVSIGHIENHYERYKTLNNHDSHKGADKVLNPDGEFGQLLETIQKETNTIIPKPLILTFADLLISGVHIHKKMPVMDALKALQSGRSIVCDIINGDKDINSHQTGKNRVQRAYQFAFSVLNSCSKYKFKASSDYNKIINNVGLITYLMVAYFIGDDLSNPEKISIDNIGLSIMSNTCKILNLSKMVSKRHYSELQLSHLSELHQILSSSSRALKSCLKEEKKSAEEILRKKPKEEQNGNVYKDLNKSHKKVKFSFI